MNKKGVQYKPYDALKGFQSALKEKEEDQKKVDKPILDNDRLEELENVITNLYIDCLVEVEYYSASKIKFLSGKVKKIDYVNKKITIETIVISINNICNIKVLSNNDF